ETVKPLMSRRLEGGKLAGATGFVYLVVLAAGLPLVAIVVSSFLKSRGPLLTGEFTLQGYANAIRLPTALFNTLFFSTVATLLCVLAGCLIGYVVVRRRDRLANLLDAFSMVPFAVAGVVIGIAVSISYGGAPFYLGGTVDRKSVV